MLSAAYAGGLFFHETIECGRSRQLLTEADVDQCQLVNVMKAADQLNSLSSVMGRSRTRFPVA